MKRITYSIVIFGLFVISIVAQRPVNNPIESLIPQDELQGIRERAITVFGLQNAPGYYDKVNEKCWGNSFILNGGDKIFSHHLTISMDYTLGLSYPDMGNTVESGSWTMVIYKDRTYSGVIFGDLVSGEIKWITDESGQLVARTTQAQLRILGGMDAFTDLPGTDYVRWGYTLSATTSLNGKREFTTGTLSGGPF